MATIQAYTESGFKRNTGNATTFRKRPDIQKRIDELLYIKHSSTGEEFEIYLKDSGLTKSYIIKHLLEIADEAKAANKFDVAAKVFKDIGTEVFGMFIENKHITVDNQNLLPTTNTTINIESLNQAIEGLTLGGRQGTTIDGHSEVIDLTGILLPPEFVPVE